MRDVNIRSYWLFNHLDKSIEAVWRGSVANTTEVLVLPLFCQMVEETLAQERSA